jgi:hypothetical protein
VTITHPFHPLQGQEVEVVSLYHREGEPDLRIRLPDGSQALIALSATDDARAVPVAVSQPPPLLDWAGLRQMSQLLARLAQRSGGELLGQDDAAG